jgi:hypothetical protein
MFRGGDLTVYPPTLYWSRFYWLIISSHGIGSLYHQDGWSLAQHRLCDTRFFRRHNLYTVFPPARQEIRCFWGEYRRSIAGGLAQNLACSFGMKVLLIFASVSYASALFFGLREGREQVLAPNQAAPRAA